MIGPLPRLYQTMLVVAVLLVGIVAGAWMAVFEAVHVATVAGASLGALAGLGGAYLLLHDFSH